MKTVLCSALRTRNKNLFVQFSTGVSVFLDPLGNILRYAASEEWQKAYTTWGTDKVEEIDIAAYHIRNADNSLVEVNEYANDISDTHTELGWEYTFLQPNGKAEKIVWITGEDWHGYEGATGYQEFKPYQYKFLRTS